MADDKPHLHVTFYIEPQEDPNETRKQGRPIFKETEMVKILIAGDPKNTFVSPANYGNPSYAERFPEHYRYFKAGLEQSTAAGTPLSEVPWLTASKREELKAVNVRTVEALASLDGTLLQRLGMGAREMKNKAQNWLDMASGTATETRLAGELAVRDEQIERMQAQINELLNRGTVAPAATVPEPPQPDLEASSNSPFESWQDEDIKNWIKDATGSRPPGNPSHKTLVARADDVNAEMAEKNRKAA